MNTDHEWPVRAKWTVSVNGAESTSEHSIAKWAHGNIGIKSWSFRDSTDNENKVPNAI